VGVRLQLQAWARNREIASVRLAWDAHQQKGRRELRDSLRLPVKPQGELAGLMVDEAVAEQLALLRANRERRQVIEALDHGNVHAAAASLASIDQHLAALPQSAVVVRERKLLEEKQELLQQDRKLSRKRLRRESLRSSLNVWESQA
jgi:Ca-activated chloride channel family protein